MNVIKKICRYLGLIHSDDDNVKATIGLDNQSNRESWIHRTLLNIPSGSRILDAGAGELQYKKFCEHLDYTSQDFGKYDGKGDNKGLQTNDWDNSRLDIISDITCIPECDASFDAIMCIEVFEHLPDPILAIKEFARLMKKGGSLILTAPFCSLTHFAPYHFYTGFSRYFYEKHLTENGFLIKEIVPNGNYFEYISQELRRIPTLIDKYTDYQDEIDLSGIENFLTTLQKLSSRDSGSSELLCYGYHVLATKE